MISFTNLLFVVLPCITQVSSTIIPIPSKADTRPEALLPFEVVERWELLYPDTRALQRDFQKRAAVHNVGRGAFTLFHGKPFNDAEETAGTEQNQSESQRTEVREQPQPESELAQHDGSVSIDKGSSFVIYNGKPVELDGKPVNSAPLASKAKRGVFEAKGKKRPGKKGWVNKVAFDPSHKGDTVSDSVEEELISIGGVGTLEEEENTDVGHGHTFALYNGRPIMPGQTL